MAFIQQALQRDGRAPSRGNIAEHLGVNRATAQQHVVALERHGVLRRLPGARGLVLVQPALTGLRVPVLGRVRAGVPLEAIENPEDALEVPDGLFQRRPDLLLRVTGDSMKDAGILEGDLIAVVLQATAESGDIIVARLDDEITVKRLRVRGMRVELVAANAAYAPIRVDGSRDFAVEGRVLGVVRRI